MTFVPGDLQATVPGNELSEFSRSSATSAALAGGGYVLTWLQQPNGPPTLDKSDIWMQRFNADGTTAGAAVQVNTTALDAQNAPQVAGLTGGNFVVTWESENQDGSGYGIYMQRYDGAGNALGGEVQVNTTTTGQQVGSAVVALANGQYVVTWTEAVENAPDDWTIAVKMQRYNANGVAQGAEITIHSEDTGGIFDVAETSFHGLDIVQLTGGNLAVSWTRSSFSDGSKAQLSILTSTGGAVAGPVEPEETEDQFNTLPQQHVVQLGNGNVLIVYMYAHDNTGAVNVGYGEVYGRIYSSSGVAVGSEFAIATGEDNRRFDLYASSDGKGGALVGWVEEAATANERTLMVQQISDSGAAIGDPMMSFVFEGNQNMAADLVVLSNGNAVVSAQTSGLGSASNIVHRQFLDGDDARFTGGDDTVALGNGGEVVAALAGIDEVTGGTGADAISGGAGSDILEGGGGKDIIHGGNADDTLEGGAGNDLIFGDDDEDDIGGGGGKDTISGGAGDDIIAGDGGDDTLYGYDGADTIKGGNGNDVLYGFGSGFENTPYGSDPSQDAGVTNELLGGGGNDVIAGGSGNDIIDGGEGNDVTRGGANFNKPSGDDTFVGSNGADINNGLDGIDTMDYTQIGRGLTVVTSLSESETRHDVTLAASGVYSAETQTLYAMEVILGSGLSDTMTGFDSADEFDGGLGDDDLFGEGGDDTLTGGGGIDELFGGDGNDTLDGQNENDTLDGGNNDDTLTGGNGNDILLGGSGNDTMSGGTGTDRFVGSSGDDSLNSTIDGVRDTFVYRLGFDRDTARSFEQGAIDLLQLDDNLWFASHGTLTAADVVSTFATLNTAGTAITFDFGNGDVMVVRGSALDLGTLDTDIQII